MALFVHPNGGFLTELTVRAVKKRPAFNTLQNQFSAVGGRRYGKVFNGVNRWHLLTVLQYLDMILKIHHSR